MLYTRNFIHAFHRTFDTKPWKTTHNLDSPVTPSSKVFRITLVSRMCLIHAMPLDVENTFDGETSFRFLPCSFLFHPLCPMLFSFPICVWITFCEKHLLFLFCIKSLFFLQWKGVCVMFVDISVVYLLSFSHHHLESHVLVCKFIYLLIFNSRLSILDMRSCCWFNSHDLALLHAIFL